MHDAGVLRARFMTVLQAGLVAGVLDISATMFLNVVILKQTTATELWQSLASGLLGDVAYQRGLETAVLGVALHFTIALVWAAIFAVGRDQLPALRRVASTGGMIAAGGVYGALVWLIMNFVVLRLSRASSDSLTDADFWAQLAIHMVCVGSPIALIVCRARGQDRAAITA